MASKTFYECGCMEQGEDYFYCDEHRPDRQHSEAVPATTDPRAEWEQSVQDYANGRGTVGALMKYGSALVAALTAKDEELRSLREASAGAQWQPIEQELAKATAKFPTWPVRGIDAAAIVAEECGELQQAALQATYEGGSVEAVRKEAVQTVAMAMQFLLNLPDTRFDRCEQVPKRALPSPPGAPAATQEKP